MSASEDFLVEIGTEELPPKSLLKLARVFRREILQGLKKHDLAHGDAELYATPRRLAVKVADVSLRQQDQTVEKRGPALKAAFDDEGNPSKAALGFASSCGVEFSALGRLSTDKGEWLSFTAEALGQDTKDLIPNIIDDALKALPIPKPMRWGSGSAEFVRPVHWVVLLLGAETIETSVLGVRSGAFTRGHRFHHPQDIALESSKDYVAALRDAYVEPDFAARRASIERATQALASKHDARAIIDPNLLDEVTALVEWPVAVCGSFEKHYLDLPREVLIASMQDHQKYFPMESSDGQLTNRFITISNIVSKDPKAIVDGNERVIRPRLSDAAFFFNQDRKQSLAARAERLDAIVFEKRLGSIGDKTRRVVHLAREIAVDFGADRDVCARAATLSRCDLVSEMVGEFPELQGLMGAYYARYDGEDEAVCDAIAEFYQPRFAGDEVAKSAAGRCIAFADKLDTLVGIFAVGAAPTGDKDPYALRRAALGCVRIALESNSTIELSRALEVAATGYLNVVDTDGVAGKLSSFILDRMRGYFAEQKIPGAVVEAVLAVKPDCLADIKRRIDAVLEFRELAEAPALAAANKRIANILRKSSNVDPARVDPAMLRDAAEQALVSNIQALRDPAEDHYARGDYTAYLSILAGLRAPVDAFFEEVMVMCEDPELQENRLNLLHELHELFSRVADIARLND